MEINVNEALDQIAKAFNVAVDELYPILYKQAIINGIYNLMWVLLSVGLIILFGFMIKFIMRKQKDGTNYDWDWDEPIVVVIIVAGVFITVVGLFVISISLKGAIDALFNTDYYVLKDILKQLK